MMFNSNKPSSLSWAVAAPNNASITTFRNMATVNRGRLAVTIPVPNKTNRNSITISDIIQQYLLHVD